MVVNFNNYDFFMIFIGGLTRLTNSGLSMVDWNPIMGIFPPQE